MHNPRENVEREGTKRSIAVAISKDKCSQDALKWALDHIVNRDQSLKLVHVNVKERLSFPLTTPVLNDDALIEEQNEIQIRDLFLPFQCFCRRRQVNCETIVLEDPDVAKALVLYVCQYRVEILLLGTTPRNGLSRLLKTTDIPGSILKWAPDFCTVYVISKGKIHGVRNASRPVPATSSAGGAPLVRQNLSVESGSVIDSERWYDELSVPDTASSGRPSTDRTFFDFYKNLESGLNEDSFGHKNLDSELFRLPRDSSRYPSLEGKDFESLYSGIRHPVELSPVPELEGLETGRTSLLSQNVEDHDDEMRRLKTELKQTMDMYHAACKEALIAKQKAMELEQWKVTEEKRLEEACLFKEIASQMVEREKAKCKAAIKEAEAAQKLVEIEVQKRMVAEMRALREAEEKKKVLNTLSQSHVVLKYQSLFRIMVVLFLFYFYFSFRIWLNLVLGKEMHIALN